MTGNRNARPTRVERRCHARTPGDGSIVPPTGTGRDAGTRVAGRDVGTEDDLGALPDGQPAAETRSPTALPLRGPLLIVLFIAFLDILGTTILTPVIVFIVRAYTGDALVVATMTAAFSAAQFLAAPLLGSLSDVYGRRPVLITSLIASVAGYVLFGLGGSLGLLILARVIAGIGGGNISTASAAIVDLTRGHAPAVRVRTFGYLGAAFGLGYVVGPALAAPLAAIDYAAPAFAGAVLAGLALLLTVTALPETFPRGLRQDHRFTPGMLNPFAPFRRLWSVAGLRGVYGSQMLFVFAFVGVSTVLPVLYVDVLGASATVVTGQFVVSGLATAFVQLRLVGPLSDQLGVGRATLLGLAVLAACYPLYLLAGQTGATWSIYAINVISGGCSALGFATFSALIAGRVPPQHQGTASGVGTAVISLTNALGPLAVGAAYDGIGWRGPLVLGFVGALASAGLLRVVLGRQTDQPANDVPGH